MKEKLNNQLRTFLIAMSFPVLFSSGCSKIEDRVAMSSYPHKTIMDADKLRDDFLESFAQYFDSRDLEYTGMESLLNDEEIAKIVDYSKTTCECDFEWNHDVSELKKKWRENSLQFLEKNVLFQSAFCDYGERDSDLFHAQVEFEIALNRVVDDFIVQASNDIDEDMCRFQSLSLVFGDLSDSLLGEYRHKHNNTIIVLDYKKILDYAEYNRLDVTDAFTSVLSHEFNHSRQAICEDRSGLGQEYVDFSYCPYAVSFLLESSAESARYNMNDVSVYEDDMYTYSYEREMEALLFLLAVCHEDAELKDYYNSIFDTDLEEFYQFFECETEEEIYNLYKIIGSMDATVGRNDRLDREKIKTFADAEAFIGYNYKINIFHSILSDMVHYTCNHSDFSLEDNLALFKITKVAILDGAYCITENDNGELERVYDSQFVTAFRESENMYYTFLSLYYQTDVSEMTQIEEDYVNAVIHTTKQLSVDEYSSSRYLSEATSLLDRFPLLEPVFKAFDVSPYSYDRFIEHNPNVYEKKK